MLSLSRALRIIGAGGLAACLAIGPATAASADYDATPFWSGTPSAAEVDLAVGGTGGFPNYRIPALTVAPNGNLLASYDGRPTGTDAPGPNSILQRRSTDGGRTWGPQTVIRQGVSGTSPKGYSDPSYVVDRETGTVFNFHVYSQNQGFFGSQAGTDPANPNILHAEVSTSTDNGTTWSHRIITASITPDTGWRSRFAASGQGIQLRYGAHAGRLVQQFTIINGSGALQAVSVYSDDHGQTWRAGTPVGTGMDENKTVELSDGRLMMNSRDSAGSKYRKISYSSDGGQTWGPVTLDRELPDPTNNAAIVRAFPNAAQGSPESKVLLFSNANSQSSRSNGTLRASCDNGQTWPIARVFRTGEMSYSTLATLPSGEVGILSEPGAGTIRFARVNLAWLQGICTSVIVSDASVTKGTSISTTVRTQHHLGPDVTPTSLVFTAPSGWNVSTSATLLRLTAGQGANYPLTITVPSSAASGSYTITGHLTDASGRRSSGTFTVTVP